jgi:hypothetical protein
MCKANTSEAPMRSIALAHRYFDAWNRHDAAAVAASLALDGTDTDPTAGPGLSPRPPLPTRRRCSRHSPISSSISTPSTRWMTGRSWAGG